MRKNNDDAGYILGSTAVIRAWPLDTDSNTSVSASEAECVVTDPDGNTDTYTYSGVDTSTAKKIDDQPEVGQHEYRFYHATAVAGTHTYRVTITSTGVSIADGFFVVRA